MSPCLRGKRLLFRGKTLTGRANQEKGSVCFFGGTGVSPISANLKLHANIIVKNF
jgi:hypothetical protein